MKIFQSAEQNEHLARDAQAVLDAAAPQVVAKLPKWIDDKKGSDPLVDDLIAYIEQNVAPQVVADERAAFEIAVLDAGFSPDAIKHDERGVYYQMDVRMMRQGWLAARHAAAPVQAQEPVAWRYEWASCITGDGPQNFKLTFDVEPPPEWAVQDGQARNVVKLFGAPVQPVAVPDGWKLVPVRMTPEIKSILKEAAPKWNAESIYGNLLEATPAAPAAQGDAKGEYFLIAKDGRHYNFFADTEAVDLLTRNGYKVIPAAAIAAKAAS